MEYGSTQGREIKNPSTANEIQRSINLNRVAGQHEKKIKSQRKKLMLNDSEHSVRTLISVSQQGLVKTWTCWIIQKSWWWNVFRSSTDERWKQGINTCMRLSSRCYTPDNSWVTSNICHNSVIWEQECMKSIQEAAHAYFHIPEQLPAPLPLLQRRSHIKILVSARRQRRRCCLFAEQLPLTETLIPPFIPPSSSSKPLKETALYDVEERKTSLHILQNRSNSLVWQKHSSLHPPQNGRERKASWRFPKTGIESTHKWWNLAGTNRRAVFFHFNLHM